MTRSDRTVLLACTAAFVIGLFFNAAFPNRSAVATPRASAKPTPHALTTSDWGRLQDRAEEECGRRNLAVLDLKAGPDGYVVKCGVPERVTVRVKVGAL